MACGRPFAGHCRPLLATLGPAAVCVPAGLIGKLPRRKGGCRHRTSTRLPSPAMTRAFPEGMVGEGRACRCGPRTVARWSHPGRRVTTSSGLTQSTSGPDRPGAARAADFSCAVVRADEGARTYPIHPCPGSGSRRRRAAPPPPWYWSRRPTTPRRGRSLPVPGRLVRAPAGAWGTPPRPSSSLAPRLVAGAGRWPIHGPRPAPPPSPEAFPGPGTPGPRPRRNPRGGSRPVAWPARPGWGRPASFLPPRAAPRPGPARRRRSPVPTKARRGTGSC